MIIESGTIVFIGLLLLAWKLPIKANLILLGRALAVDFTITVLTYVTHYGTFTGIMAAAVAGLMCSAFTGIAAKVVGYIRDGVYYPGMWNIHARIADVPLATAQQIAAARRK